MSSLSVRGMGGLGDAIHQRALIRRWLEMGYGPIWLETSHPELYWDFRQSGQVKCVPLCSPLRTQAKNESEAAYDGFSPPPCDESRTIWYTPGRIKREGSILKAMAGYSGCEGAHDISLPIHQDWQDIAEQVRRDKPLLIYRPPVLRKEWYGPARNPDPKACALLIESIRKDYHVISVADLVDGVEWLDGEPVKADQTFHAGELHYTTIAALMAMPGTLVISPPGFGMVMGRAVGAFTCGVFGGFELPAWWMFGTPCPERFMTIAPVAEIPDGELWMQEADIDKRIDLGVALGEIKAFAALARDEYGRFQGNLRLASAAD